MQSRKVLSQTKKRITFILILFYYDFILFFFHLEGKKFLNMGF